MWLGIQCANFSEKPFRERTRTREDGHLAHERHPSPYPSHEPPKYEKTASSPQPSPPEEEREMRSRCLARAINRSLLTEFAAVWGFKVRNFISAKSLPVRGEGSSRTSLVPRVFNPSRSWFPLPSRGEGRVRGES